MARQSSGGSRGEASKQPEQFVNRYAVAPVEGEQNNFDWGKCDGGMLAAAISYVTSEGDAVSFARTRSGSTGSITVLAGAVRLRWYVSGVQEADDLLYGLQRGEARQPDSETHL